MAVKGNLNEEKAVIFPLNDRGEGRGEHESRTWEHQREGDQTQGAVVV